MQAAGAVLLDHEARSTLGGHAGAFGLGGAAEAAFCPIAPQLRWRLHARRRAGLRAGLLLAALRRGGHYRLAGAREAAFFAAGFLAAAFLAAFLAAGLAGLAPLPSACASCARTASRLAFSALIRSGAGARTSSGGGCTAIFSPCALRSLNSITC